LVRVEFPYNVVLLDSELVEGASVLEVLVVLMLAVLVTVALVKEEVVVVVDSGGVVVGEGEAIEVAHGI
jgi:hypothetical protein